MLLLLKMHIHTEKRLENMPVYSDCGIRSEFFCKLSVSQLSIVLSLLSLTKKTYITKNIDKLDNLGSNILHESYTFWILAISHKMISSGLHFFFFLKSKLVG